LVAVRPLSFLEVDARHVALAVAVAFVVFFGEGAQYEPAIDRQCVERDVEAFAVFVGPGRADARPECVAILFFVVSDHEHFVRRSLIVTHDITTAQRYCDRVMLLRNGKIEMIGDPQKVGSKYIYQNMSDEERRILDEEKRQKIKAEKENVQLVQEREIAERRQQTEEEKKQQEEKIKKEEERRNKVAEITRVEFLDKNENVKNMFKTGDDISIRVYYEKRKDVNILNFGMGIRNQEGNYILGMNTMDDKIDVKAYIKQGYFQVNYKKIPLRTNSYYIMAGIWGKNEGINYDFLTKSNMFKVYSEDKLQGMLNLDYEWNK